LAKKNYVSTLDLGAQLAAGGAIPVAGEEATAAETSAAKALGAELVNLARQRPLSRTWSAKRTDGGEPVAVVTVADTATADERELFARTAEAIVAAGEALPGVLRVRALAPTRDAFLTDLWTTGSARDLSALNWPLRRRVEFVLGTVRTLGALHAHGIVHGCLSPANVLLDDHLGPVLAEAGSVPVHALMARGGGVAPYTPFAAPEVIKGGEVDARSDVYSAGRLLEDLAKGDKAAVTLSGVVRRATLADPAARYPSAAELAAAIEGVVNLLSDAPPGSPSASGPPSGRPPSRPSLHSSPRAERRSGPAPGIPSRAPARSLDAPWAAPPWIGAAGLTAMALALAASAVIGGANDRLRAVLWVSLGAGAALATTLARVPKTWRSGRAAVLQLLLAAACGWLVLFFDPLPRGYRYAALGHLHGDDASTRAAVAEIMRLGGDFRGVSLASLDLSGDDLGGADLAGVDLSRANLTRAVLAGAVVRGASFDGASLAGASLEQVDLSQTNVARASCDGETRLPRGWVCRETHLERAGAAP
jgi:Pentapeptide repeats (8 copies)